VEKIKIGGIMQSDGRALVRILAVPKDPTGPAVICGTFAAKGINIELMVESYDLDDNGNFCLVIAQKDLYNAVNVLEEIKLNLEAKGISYVHDVVIISVFGPHLREKPMVPGRMFAALASAGITSLAVSNSISSLSCVLEGQYVESAMEALEEVFDIPFSVAKRPQNW